jgi:hypothetical protein
MNGFAIQSYVREDGDLVVQCPTWVSVQNQIPAQSKSDKIRGSQP